MVIKRDFRRLAPATQAELRRIAVAMVRAGKTRVEAAATVGVNRRFVGQWAQHLSVNQTSPELWEREAFEEQLDGAPEATGEPGKSSAGELGRLAVRGFFSAGAGLFAWSPMPVETAQ